MKSKTSVKTIFTKTILGISAVSALLGLGIVQTAHAQVGTGWTQIHPNLIWNGDLPITERYSKSGNVEHFWVYNTDPHGPTGSGSRSEWHVSNTFSTGSEQAQGDFMPENNTDAYTVFQDFGSPINASAMQLQVRSGNGTLRVYNNQAVATGCWGIYTRINVVHYLDTGTIEVWANGSKKTSFGDGGPHDHWFKYGDYDTGSASYYTGCYWRGMSFFEGGSPGSGSGIDTSATYQIQNEASGLSLNVSGGSTANSALIIQYAYNGAANEKFTFVPTDSGYYQMVNVNSGKDVVVQGASTANGALIIQYQFGSAQNDQWEPQQNSDGSYTFVNRHSGLVLEDPASSTLNSTQMDQWGSNGGANQKWKLIKQ